MLKQVDIKPLFTHLKAFLQPTQKTKLLLVRNAES
jgi:hypothetical protein